MNPGFQCFYDSAGDLQVTDGVVIARATGAVFAVGAGGELAANPPPSEGEIYTLGREASGTTHPGGSGRNLICDTPLTSGITRRVLFVPEVTDSYRFGEFLLVKTGASAATISDDVDVVAELTTGGTAPVGNYVLTTYGAATYNSSAAATLVLTAEQTAPGTIPDVTVTISDGSAVGGLYTATDASNYVSATDPDWTLELQPGGAGYLKYAGTVVAIRTAGLAYDPTGGYVAETAAFYLNPTPPAEEVQGEAAEANPFGVLTISYSWVAMPDLDTATTFLGASVGYGYGSATTYMTFTGDNTTTGSEVVTIDLAAAWTAGQITTHADILCAADWYPGASPSQGSGPASLTVSYSLSGVLFSGTIFPGLTGPATSLVRALRILAGGTLESADGTWTATVKRNPVPPRPGTVYLRLTETAGALTAVTGPFFATTLPTNTTGVFHYPLAISDGVGGIRQLHTGAIQWQATGLVFGTVAVASDPTITAAGFTHQVPATDPAGAVWLLPAVAAVTPATNQDGTTPLNEDSTPQTDE